MATLLRYTARRRLANIIVNNDSSSPSTLRAWSSSPRRPRTDPEAWDYAQEREAAVLRRPLVRRYLAHEQAQVPQPYLLWRPDGLPRREITKIRRLNLSHNSSEPLKWRPDGPRPAPRDQRDRPANATVSVPAPTGSYSFSAVFLRDLCSCPLCVDPATKQKLFATADIPKQIQAAEVQINAEGVRIKWNHDVPGYTADHVTELPRAVLAKYGATGDDLPKQDATPRVLWDARMYQQQIQDFTYEAYMEDDMVLLKALRQLQSHGLLFVTNVPSDEKSVERLSKRIGPLKTTFYGETWDVRSVPQAKNVAYTSQNLGFHMDLMYMKQPPHLQLLHCIRSSSAGGASLFADSFKAAVDLCQNDLSSFTTLSKIEVDYHYDHETDYYHQARPVVEQQADLGRRWHEHLARAGRRGLANPGTGRDLEPIDFIDSISWSPPFQAPFRLEFHPDRPYANQGDRFLSRKVDSWLDAASKFNELIHRPEAIYERLMKPGECVIFDNRRVLHARKAFEVGDQGEERWLKGAYIDKDPFMSKLKILSERYGDANDAAKIESEEGDGFFEMQKET